MDTDISSWLHRAAVGRYVHDWELSLCDQWVSDVFGYHALQVGLSASDFLRNSRVKHHFYSEARPTLGAQLLHPVYQLPFQCASLDLVVLPHVLDFCAHPHEVLRETERVLVPDGTVIVAGFNPFSLWRVQYYIPLCGHALPKKGHFLSAQRVKDWFALLGFEIQACCYQGYRPAFRGHHIFENLSFLDKVGQRLWPVLGGAYIMCLKKRVQGMHVINPHWRKLGLRHKKWVPAANKSRINTRIYKVKI